MRCSQAVPKPIAIVGLEFSLMDAIQLLFSDHSDRKLKSEETLFVCPLISRGNNTSHVPSVNHPYFNQYLLHKLKEKLIKAITLLAKEIHAFCRGRSREVTFGVSVYTSCYCFQQHTSQSHAIQMLPVGK
jgi:hypothetical protein